MYCICHIGDHRIICNTVTVLTVWLPDALTLKSQACSPLPEVLFVNNYPMLCRHTPWRSASGSCSSHSSSSLHSSHSSRLCRWSAAAAGQAAVRMRASLRPACLQERAAAADQAACWHPGLLLPGTSMQRVSRPCQRRSTASPAKRASRYVAATPASRAVT